MQAACINVDITWSDARLTLSVNTGLFKQLSDTLQPAQKLRRFCKHPPDQEVEQRHSTHTLLLLF